LSLSQVARKSFKNNKLIIEYLKSVGLRILLFINKLSLIITSFILNLTSKKDFKAIVLFIPKDIGNKFKFKVRLINLKSSLFTIINLGNCLSCQLIKQFKYFFTFKRLDLLTHLYLISFQLERGL
jgi:hypothetical protein